MVKYIAKSIAKSIAPRSPIIGDVICVKYGVEKFDKNKNKFYKAKEKWYAGSIRSVITKHKKNYQCSVKFVKDGECETLDLGLSTYEKEWFIAKEKIEEIVEEEDSEEEVVEPIVESAKEVVEPIVESAKEVVEKIPDTPDLNEKQLKDRMESLERVVNQLMQDNNGVYIHGSCSNHAANAFHNMTPTLKSQYLVGPKLCDPKFQRPKLCVRIIKTCSISACPKFYVREYFSHQKHQKPTRKKVSMVWQRMYTYQMKVDTFTDPYSLRNS